MKDLPVRKNIRLKNYDYSQNGAYFVTFCVKDRHKILGKAVGGGFHAAPDISNISFCVKDRHEILGKAAGGGFHAAPDISNISYIQLSEIGAAVVKAIEYVNEHYDGIKINKYVVMPNHVHMIAVLTGGHGNPPLPKVIGQIKSFTTRRWNEICGMQMQEFWQRSYHDHIIRNEEEYQKIWQYIDENPARWEEDCYFGL